TVHANNETFKKYVTWSFDELIEKFFELNLGTEKVIFGSKALQDKEQIQNIIAESIQNIKNKITPFFEDEQQSGQHKFILVPLVSNQDEFNIRIEIESFLNQEDFFVNEIKRHLIDSFFRKETQNLFSTIKILFEEIPDVVEFLSTSPNLIENRKTENIDTSVIEFFFSRLLNISFER
ncbi:MAG: hypothetical protein AAFZ15_34655, partial [Bacteroidota bacterium]